MTTYAFATGQIKDNGCEATLHGVSLDFSQLDGGGHQITGMAQSISVEEGTLPELAPIVFNTVTSNFGVRKAVTIKLNQCRLTGNTFEAVVDQDGNVFTLSMEE